MQKLKNSISSKPQNRLAGLENLDYNVDINRACENIRENIYISAKGSQGHYDKKQHKPWFDKECQKY
jgi:hypothetical protein